MTKKIISILLLSIFFTTTFTPNIAEAKYFNMSNPGSEKPSTGDGAESDGIEIIKHLGTNIETTIKEIDDDAGNSAQGSNGISVAFAYLTPQKQSGVVVRENINILSSSASNKESYDEIGNVWTKSLKQTDVQTFYRNAVDDFTNNKTIENAVSLVTADDITNNKVAVQQANDGKTFVATTFYVRWFYDVNTQRKDYSNLYLDCVPALSKYNGSNGPYVSWGDFFSSTERLIPGRNPEETYSTYKNNKGETIIITNSDQNITNRTTLANKADKYVRNLEAITGKRHTGLYLTYDPVYGTSTSPKSGVYTYDTKPFYEKSFEYRRYFTKNSGSSLDYYEMVYPIEYHKITTNETEATKGIESSIEARTIFTDTAQTNVVRYEFDFNISPLVAEKSGIEELESPKEYTINHEVSTASPGTEPPEDKVDIWQNVVSKKIEIRNKTDKLLCTKDIDKNSGTIKVYPNEVNYENLTGCTAILIVEYKNLYRYMESKEVYTYEYKWYDKKGSSKNQTYEYSKLYENLKDNKQVITEGFNKLEEHHKNNVPRNIYTYVTLGLDDNPLTHKVEDIIIGARDGDPITPKLTVKVNPPNALTVLEGGIFDINIEFNPNGISIGRDSSSTYVWIENLVIKPVIVTAQNEEVIYRKNTPISDFSNSKLTESINGVTANPSHIGKAKVSVDYTYTLVEEYHGKRWAGFDEKGNEQYEEYVEMHRTECKGTAKDYFNIYSLTATTTK